MPSAEIFAALAESEQERQQMLHAWAEAEGLALGAEVDPLDWQDPNVKDTYDAAAVDPIRSTPYRVLAMFAHSAERGFRYYSYVAAYTSDAAIREYAEILAEEELERAAQARKKRRVAWHAQRAQNPGWPVLHPVDVGSLADLFCVAAALEQRVCRSLKILDEEYRAFKTLALASEESLSEIRALARSCAVGSEMAAAEAEAIANSFDALGQTASPTPGSLLQLYSDIDRCFTYYDALVNCAEDEAIMLQAQQFAFSAMARIDLLHEAVLE